MSGIGSNYQSLHCSTIWVGFRQFVPLGLFVLIFGAAFGLAALQSGLSEWATILMSALVFAGYSQFAAIKLWGEQVTIITLLLTVFAINARHLLMGASLYPWLKHVHCAKRYGMLLVLSDANWVMAMQNLKQGKQGLGILLGGGLSIWLFWVVGTGVGVYFGRIVDDPMQWGVDMVMGCFLLSMVLLEETNLRMLVIWVVAAGMSLVAYWYFPANTYVLAGALAGGFLGLFFSEQEDEH